MNNNYRGSITPSNCERVRPDAVPNMARCMRGLSLQQGLRSNTFDKNKFMAAAQHDSLSYFFIC